MLSRMELAELVAASEPEEPEMEEVELAVLALNSSMAEVAVGQLGFSLLESAEVMIFLLLQLAGAVE